MTDQELSERLDEIVFNNMSALKCENTEQNREILKLYVLMTKKGIFTPQTIRESAKEAAEYLTFAVPPVTTEQINAYVLETLKQERALGNDFSYDTGNVAKIVEYVHSHYQGSFNQATVSAATQYLRGELRKVQPPPRVVPPRQKTPRELERLQPGQISMYATLEELARPEVTATQLKNRTKRRLAAGLPRD